MLWVGSPPVPYQRAGERAFLCEAFRLFGAFELKAEDKEKRRVSNNLPVWRRAPR
jgi:hypothetical protein